MSEIQIALERRIAELEAERDALRAALARYGSEVPLGHQPPMLAHKVDDLIGASRKYKRPWIWNLWPWAGLKNREQAHEECLAALTETALKLGQLQAEARALLKEPRNEAK